MTTSNEHNNAPSVPQGEPVAWLDLSKMSASAMVYATGWKSNDKQSPLYATPAATEQAAPAVPQGWKLVPVEPTPEMIRCAEMWDEGFEGAYARALAATAAPAPAQDEPLGHFRVEPFGWTDCAEDDEGAIALYERPQEVGLTDEERADMACAVAAICTGASSRTVAATAIEWTERALRAKGGK